MARYFMYAKHHHKAGYVFGMREIEEREARQIERANRAELRHRELERELRRVGT
jgi:hypothetical protein